MTSLPAQPHFHLRSQKEGPVPTVTNPQAPSLATSHSFDSTRDCALYSCLWHFDQEAQTPRSPRNLPPLLVPSHCTVPSVISFLNISFTFLLQTKSGSPENTASSAALSDGGPVESGGERIVLFAPQCYFQIFFISLQR